MTGFPRRLRQAVRAGRLPHAALIAGGPEAAREAALSLAAAHNCEAPEAWRPCCEAVGREDAGEDALCGPCRKTVSGAHPDIFTIDCSQGGVTVERVRRMCASMTVKPNEARVKVYIVHDAQLLSPTCQNALLAALEEPVSSAFILTCDRPGALLPTVRSRLTRWDAAGDGGAGPDGAHAAAADAVLTAIDGGCEQSLLLASLACDTLDREQTALMLDRVRGGLLRRLRGEPDPPDAARLLDAARALGELRETLARNAGVGHVCGAMAAILSNTIKTN